MVAFFLAPFGSPSLDQPQPHRYGNRLRRTFDPQLPVNSAEFPFDR